MESSTSLIGVGDADLMGLLERLEKHHPQVSRAVLSAEVDALLGREQTVTRASRLPPTREGHRSRRSTAFDWYRSISAALPPVLTAERSIEAARAIEAGLLAQDRLASLDLSAVPREDVQDLHALVDHGQSEYQTMVLSNVRLVFHWCKGIALSMGENWVQDAFQAGFLGLIRGVEGWDHKLGYTFSTYVSWHIRQQLQRWRMNETLVIRVPVHVWERLEAKELSPDLAAAARIAMNVISTDLIDPEDSGMHWDGGIDSSAGAIDRGRLISQIMSVLSPREAAILQLRHGLSPLATEPHTLERIGEMLGVTRERIRQIERQAVQKIRTISELHPPSLQ